MMDFTFKVGDSVAVNFALGSDIVKVTAPFLQFVRYCGWLETYRVVNVHGHQDVVGVEHISAI